MDRTEEQTIELHAWEKPMKRIFWLFLATLLLSALPSVAGLAVYGSYWDTEAMGDTGGVGVAFRSDEKGFAWELRGGYFPDLTRDFESLLDDPESVDFDLDLKAIPIDLGIAFQFGSDSGFRPYVGGGVSYFLLDSSFGSVSDEVGFYALGGLELGSGSFALVVEGIFRVVEGTLESDIEDWQDIIDFEIDERIDIDLGGYGINVGVVWRF